MYSDITLYYSPAQASRFATVSLSLGWITPKGDCVQYHFEIKTLDNLRIMGVHCRRHEGVIHSPENDDSTITFYGTYMFGATPWSAVWCHRISGQLESGLLSVFCSALVPSWTNPKGNWLLVAPPVLINHNIVQMPSYHLLYVPCAPYFAPCVNHSGEGTSVKIPVLIPHIGFSLIPYGSPLRKECINSGITLSMYLMASLVNGAIMACQH